MVYSFKFETHCKVSTKFRYENDHKSLNLSCQHCLGLHVPPRMNSIAYLIVEQLIKIDILISFCHSQVTWSGCIEGDYGRGLCLKIKCCWQIFLSCGPM